MAPSKLQEFIAAMRQTFDRFAAKGEVPVLLTSPAIRPYVRSIVERFRSSTTVVFAERDPSQGAAQDLGTDPRERPGCACGASQRGR